MIGMLALSQVLPDTLVAFRTILGYASMLICALLLFRDKWPRTLLAVSILWVIQFLSEILLLVVFPSVAQEPRGLDALPYDLHMMVSICLAAFIALMLWLASMMFNRKTNMLGEREWLLFVLFPTSQVAMFTVWVQAAAQPANMTRTVLLLVFILVSIASDIALYYAIRGMSQRAELKAKTDLLTEQIEFQNEHYAALTEQFESIRRMRHDIANHMYTVQILLDNGQMRQAQDYVAELIPQHTFHASLGRCENPIVDAFLFGRVQRAEKKGIAVHAMIVMPAETGVANTDLIGALGNLLDNAEEACLTVTSEPYMDIDVCAERNALVIRVENALPQEPLHRRKIPYLDRGIGFHVLNGIAARYDGAFVTMEADGKFTAKLTLCCNGMESC